MILFKLCIEFLKIGSFSFARNLDCGCSCLGILCGLWSRTGKTGMASFDCILAFCSIRIVCPFCVRLQKTLVRAARFLYYSQDFVCSVYSRVGIYIGLRYLVVYQVGMGNGGDSWFTVLYFLGLLSHCFTGPFSCQTITRFIYLSVGKLEASNGIHS